MSRNKDDKIRKYNNGILSNGIVRYDFICRIFGHKKEYTEEYRNQEGNVQSDKVCVRCDNSELAWVGPTVTEIEDACDKTVPSKKTVYRDIDT